MATLAVFARRIDAIGKGIAKNAHEKVIAATIFAMRNLALRTPVDTGRARANWLVGINRPRREVKNKGALVGTVAAGQAAAAASKAGDTVYISNNLPYINRLNDGWSGQAPPGFVEASVRDAILAARRIKIVRSPGGKG